jgi:hypothetical protein
MILDESRKCGIIYRAIKLRRKQFSAEGQMLTKESEESQGSYNNMLQGTFTK